MRFILMHKNDAHTEAGERPSDELIANMGAFIGEHVQRGTLLDGQGLGASATRTRLTFRDGNVTIKHGPYKGDNELPAAMLLLSVRDRDEAIGWAERYGKILHNGEIEIGKLNEPWDLGMMPKPENPPFRALLLEKEAAPLSAKQKADLTRLKTEMKKAGVMLSGDRIEPSSKAKRLLFTNNNLKVVDGPFAESKELVGGYAVFRMDNVDDVIAECKRYAKILGGTLELDIRLLEEPTAETGS